MFQHIHPIFRAMPLLRKVSAVCSASVFLLAIILLATSLSIVKASEQSVSVSSKIDTEGSLLGELIIQTLSANGIPVDNKLSLGATNIVRKALENGEIDIYPEYTGNGAFFSQRPEDEVWKSLEGGYNAIKEWDSKNNQLVWLSPAPANNTWAIAVTRALAEASNLQSLEDFAKYVNEGGKLKLAASAEFVNSPVALPSFQSVYEFSLDESQLLVLSGGNTSATIKAAAEGINDTNAAMVYGTDGAIAAADLVVLSDTKGAQAVYAPAPVIRAEVLEKYPAIEELLAPVFSQLTREVLQQLNEKIQVQGLPAKQVAKDFLTENKLVN